MNPPDPKLRRIILLTARPRKEVLLSDLIRYEKATGDRIGKGIVFIEGKGNTESFIEALEILYPMVNVPEEINAESAKKYLEEVVFVAMEDIGNRNERTAKEMFAVFEHVFITSNIITQKLAIDFLENLQTLFINSELSQDTIDAYILSRARIWWQEIQRFWDAAGDWMKLHPEANPMHETILQQIKEYLARSGSGKDLRPLDIFKNFEGKLGSEVYKTYPMKPPQLRAEVVVPSENPILEKKPLISFLTFTDNQSTRIDAFYLNIPANVSGKKHLLDIYATMLPEYFGRNWDALNEMLHDLSWIEKKTVIIQHTDLPKLDEKDLKIYLLILAETVQLLKAGPRKDFILPYGSHRTEIQFPASLKSEIEKYLGYQLFSVRAPR